MRTKMLHARALATDYGTAPAPLIPPRTMRGSARELFALEWRRILLLAVGALAAPFVVYALSTM